MGRGGVKGNKHGVGKEKEEEKGRGHREKE